MRCGGLSAALPHTPQWGAQLVCRAGGHDGHRCPRDPKPRRLCHLHRQGSSSTGRSLVWDRDAFPERVCVLTAGPACGCPRATSPWVRSPGDQQPGLRGAGCTVETLRFVPSFKSGLFSDRACAFSARKQLFGSDPWLHQSGMKTVRSSLAGLQVLIIFSIFLTLSSVPDTAYFWLMLLASSSF